MQALSDPIATPVREVKLAGHTIAVCDDKPTFWERVSNGTWEPDVIQAILTHVGPHTLFLDLGAWVGPTTLLAALCGARCIAVEADPQAQSELQGNVAANPELASRVEVIERAVSATSEPVALAARRKPGDSMSSVLLAEQDEPGRTAWSSAAITPTELAALCPADSSLFIKMDIEGGEFALLPRMGPLLHRKTGHGTRTQALVSFHPGILRETGRSDQEIEALVMRALMPFNGWQGQEISASAGDDGGPDAGAIARGEQSDVWLFTRPNR